MQVIYNYEYVTTCYGFVLTNINLKLITNNYSHFTSVLTLLLSSIGIIHSMISTK